MSLQIFAEYSHDSVYTVEVHFLQTEYRHIVRVAGTDIDGSLKLVYGLKKIKGVGIRLAQAIVNLLELDPNMRVGYLDEETVKKIEDVLAKPLDYGIPSWFLNRRRDIETGKDLHLLGSDLVYSIKMDIQRMKRIRSWKGVRHALGLKVRGQRTKTTGRTGRTVGVSRRRR